MDIVEELRTNRESGAKRLEIEYKAGLMTLAKRFHADESDAEELVNRTFAAVVNGIDGYLARSAFFTWMCQILVNLHANDTRRKANGAVVYPGTIPDVADESSQEAVYSAMDASMLRDAIETLPEEMRKTLLLHYFMDMPVKDIARFLAIPSGTVLWRLHYARQMLAAKLGAKAKRPGGKAILLALAFAALTAIGAAGVAAVRYVAGHGAEEAEVVFNAEGAEGALTGFTGLEETGDMPNATNSGQGEGGSGQAGATTAISETSNEECTMNIQSIKSAAVKTLAAGAMLAAGAAQGFDCYVATTGSDGNAGTQGAPFATIAKAITAADAAIAGGDTSATIHIADGTYVEYNLNVTNAITIVGESGDRDAVIVDANQSGRAFKLNHASATLSGITVRNGSLWSGSGGNVLIDANGGVVTNCVILKGGNVNGGNISLAGASALVMDCVVSNGTARSSQGGNIHATGGRVSRCVVANGKTSDISGGNAYLANSAVMENCLVIGGVVSKNNSNGANGVLLAGSSRLVNCTIVKNKANSFPDVPAVRASAYTVRVVNCVIYGNGGTLATEWGGASACYVNCAVAADAEITGGTGNIATLSDVAFKDPYAKDDYRPAIGSVLVDAGCDPSSYAFGCSPDLDGAARPSGNAWDIGCYEYDGFPASVFVIFNASAGNAINGETVTFTPQVFGLSGPFTFKWNFDDGAGDEISFDETMTHAFATTGYHHPTVSVSTDGGSTWAASFTAAVPIQTAPPVMWLDASNASPEYPYATEADAATSLADALSVLTDVKGDLAVDGVTIKVKPGTYIGGIYPEISIGLTILGVGDRDEIIFDARTVNGGRVFRLNHPAATLSGITVRNGTYWNGNGGNILIDAHGGVVTNCVALSGVAQRGGNISLNGDSAIVVDCVVTNGSTQAPSQGGNIYAAGGRVSRCLVANGTTTAGYSGGNAYLDNSAVIENCLVMGGVVKQNNSSGANGVYLTGSTRMVNCTIVKNGSDSYPDIPAVNAGASTVRAVNCAIYGNGDSVAREWGGANSDCFTNCAFAASAGYSGTASTVTNLTDAAFKDYANGDYRPAKGGALVNAGTKWADYLSFGATSEADLEGAVRLSGRFLDIGCYEIASRHGFTLFVR